MERDRLITGLRKDLEGCEKQRKALEQVTARLAEDLRTSRQKGEETARKLADLQKKWEEMESGAPGMTPKEMKDAKFILSSLGISEDSLQRTLQSYASYIQNTLGEYGFHPEDAHRFVRRCFSKSAYADIWDALNLDEYDMGDGSLSGLISKIHDKARFFNLQTK